MKTIKKSSIMMLCMFVTTAFFASCEDDKDESATSSTEVTPSGKEDDNTGGGNDTSEADIETINVNGVKFQMVKIQGGTFQMGATSEQGNDISINEKPIHSVTLSDYHIGQTQVT